MLFEIDQELAKRHRNWLGAFDTQHLRNWERLLANDPQAAMCEAEVRKLLAKNGCEVIANEDMTGQCQAPDFLCRHPKGSFCVEVTCLGIEKVSEVTKLPHLPDGQFGFYRLLNESIFNACKRKTPQCAQSDLPCLMAVGTFHVGASRLCLAKRKLPDLLTGVPQITWNIDMQIGQALGDPYETTKLESAAFVRPSNKGEIEHARDPVSGMLICGLGCYPPSCYGVLHPSPARIFPRELLPDIEFCRLKEGYEQGQLSTEWI